jgi:hypothetical protein
VDSEVEVDDDDDNTVNRCTDDNEFWMNESDLDVLVVVVVVGGGSSVD